MESDNFYRQMYEYKSEFAKELREILGDAIDTMSNLVKAAAEGGLQDINSEILLKENERILKALKAAQDKYISQSEPFMQKVIEECNLENERLKGESYETANDID